MAVPSIAASALAAAVAAPGVGKGSAVASATRNGGKTAGSDRDGAEFDAALSHATLNTASPAPAPGTDKTNAQGRPSGRNQDIPVVEAASEDVGQTVGLLTGAALFVPAPPPATASANVAQTSTATSTVSSAPVPISANASGKDETAQAKSASAVTGATFAADPPTAPDAAGTAVQGAEVQDQVKARAQTIPPAPASAQIVQQVLEAVAPAPQKLGIKTADAAAADDKGPAPRIDGSTESNATAKASPRSNALTANLAAPTAADASSTASLKAAGTGSPEASGPAPAPAQPAAPPAQVPTQALIPAQTDDAPATTLAPPLAPQTQQTASATPVALNLSTLSRTTVDTTVQIAAQITRQLNGRSTRFEMGLTPEGLGRVDVSMDIDADGQLTARLAFDNPLAATELRGRVDELRSQLQEAGFKVSNDSLTFSERDASSSDGGSNQRQNRAFTGAARINADADAALPVPGPWVSLSLTPRGVDMKV